MSPKIVIPATDKELYEKVKRSDIFEKHYELLATDARYRSLPKHHQTSASAILLYNPHLTPKDIGDVIQKAFFKRPVPTIKEFLTEEYLGDTGKLVYPKWREDLEEVFAPTSNILEWVMTGAIGTGKSTVALIAHLYNLYRINSLKNPQRYMGSDPTKPMTLQLFSVTLEKAESTLVTRVKTFLEIMKNYRRVHSEMEFLSYQGEATQHITPWMMTENAFIFPHNVRIMYGSQSRHALGEDVFGGLLDESEFRIGLSHGDLEHTFELYYEILERIRSRFLGKPFILMTILSSIKNARGVMATHMQEAAGKPTSKVSSYSIWETKFPDAFKEHGHFWVMRGTQRHPSRVLLPQEETAADSGTLTLPPATEIIKVPGIYREDFERRTERSLMNLAGKASMGAEIPFDDLTTIEDRSLCPVLTLTAPLQETRPLRAQLPKELFVSTPEGLRLKRYPGATRYGHADLADVGQAALAIVHKEMSITGRIIYVTDFLFKITSPNRVSLDAVRDLILDMRAQYGISFKTFTADQYQSTQLLQKLQALHFCETATVLSVDKKRFQYDTLSAVVAEDSLKVGLIGELKQQLESIYFENDKVRKPTTIDGAHCDLADAICGAVFNAVQNPTDIPINSYEYFNNMQYNVEKLKQEYELLSA